MYEPIPPLLPNDFQLFGYTSLFDIPPSEAGALSPVLLPPPDPPLLPTTVPVLPAISRVLREPPPPPPFDIKGTVPVIENVINESTPLFPFIPAVPPAPPFPTLTVTKVPAGIL